MEQYRRTITCDIDGVLTDYPICWLKYLEEKCGTYYSSVEEARQSEKNYSAFKDMYRESNYKANLPVNEGNKKALNQLADMYDVIITTSRPINSSKYPTLLENTTNWLKKNGLKFKELRYKDETADFIKDLDLAFHIDDEVKYANSIAESINQSGKGDKAAVYLLTDNINIDVLKENVIIVKDIQEIIDSPFFSVCIPATNRGETIYRALKSVSKQTYRNFELLIVDCLSKDNTVKEVEKFFCGEDFKENSFKYRFVKTDTASIGTEDWNEPIRLAKGKYIAMLEGDDYWEADHLMNAYKALSKNPNIGLYGSSNQYMERPFEGVLTNKKAKEYCYAMKQGVVPPSESIFVRCNSFSKQYYYNSSDYNYSPEIGLYVDIVLDGYDIFYSRKKDVFREPSTNPNKMKTWYYFADRFVMIKKYKSRFGSMAFFDARLYNTMLVISFALYTRSKEMGVDLIKNLATAVGWFMVNCCMIGSIVKINFLRGMKRIKRLIKK